MTDIREPKAGGNPKSPKKVHGRGWLLKRARHGKTWKQRKMASSRYCPAVPRG